MEKLEVKTLAHCQKKYEGFLKLFATDEYAMMSQQQLSQTDLR